MYVCCAHMAAHCLAANFFADHLHSGMVNRVALVHIVLSIFSVSRHVCSEGQVSSISLYRLGFLSIPSLPPAAKGIIYCTLLDLSIVRMVGNAACIAHTL